MGVILAMAAGGIVFLLLMTMVMYACCKGHQAGTSPDREIQQETVAAIYNPSIVYRHGQWLLVPLSSSFFSTIFIHVVCHLQPYRHGGLVVKASAS